jgi:hypothetical protein
VEINRAGNYTVTVTASAAAGTLASTGVSGTNKLNLASGSLKISGWMTLGTGTALTLGSGLLKLGGDSSVAGPTDWTTATLSGPFSLRLQGPLTTVPGHVRRMSNLVMVLAGGGSGGGIAFHAGASISNAPGSAFDFTDGNGFGNASGGNQGAILNAGTFRFTQSGSATVDVQLSNSGLLTVESGTLRLQKDIAQTSGETKLTGGTLTTPAQFALRGGLLSGTGTITGSITNSAGTVRPGGSPGRLTISGSYGQGPAGTLEIDLGGAAPETGFDVLSVSGPAVLNGTLRVTQLNGFVPTDGSEFAFLPSANHQGRFDAVVLGAGLPRMVVRDSGDSLSLLASDKTFTEITLGNTAATITQGGFSVDQTINGITGTFSEGWAPNHSASIAVWETLQDVVLPRDSRLRFRLIQDYPFTTHTIGRFRLSYTTDARSEFADGVQNGGDVSANWNVLVPESVTATNVAQFSILEDGSILAGNATPVTVYDFVAVAPAAAITGFRLEVLEHPSLPSNGPGFAGNKNLVLTEFRVSAEIPPATGHTLLSFDIDGIADFQPINQAYGDRVTALTNGGFRYGGEAPFTPNITVAYGDSRPALWTTGYGSLTNVLFEDQDGSGILTLTFAADPGFLVELDSLDLAAFTSTFPGGTNITSLSLRNGESIELFSRTNFFVTASASNHIDFPDTARAPVLVLRLDARNLGANNDDIAIDNIAFHQVATNGLPVEALVLAPASTNRPVGTGLVFTGSGGVAPYLFSVATNRSGASINPFTGAYVAGSQPNVFDTVRVTDARGTNAFATVSVLPDPTPRPDLAVHSITAPASAVPGTPFEVVYVVTNRGTATASAPWSAFVFTSADAVIGGDTFLAASSITAQMPPATSLSVTQSVVVPVTGDAGQLRLVVAVDASSVVVELDESNNTAISAQPTAVPQQLRLTGTTASMTEGGATTVTVTRNGPRAPPLLVNLASDDTTELTVPLSITIPSGAVSANFTASAQTDGLFDGPQVAFVDATASGFEPATLKFTILDADVPALSLTLATNVIPESGSTAAKLIRQGPTNAALAVTISGGGGQVAFPGTVNIPAGTNVAYFFVVGVPDTLIEADVAVTVEAAAPGYASTSATLTVVDDDVPVVVVSVASPSVSEGAGPNATQGTVTRNLATSRPVTIRLTSSNPGAATVPATVVIPAGQLSASFPVAAVDNALVDGDRVVKLGGFIVASEGGQTVGATVPAGLTVTDNDGPALSLTLDKVLVGEGQNPAATGTVTRNTAPTGSLVVSLLSSDTTELTVPASVTLADGAASATFALVSIADGTNDGNQTVTLTASATGFSSASANVVVSDSDLPDLRVSSITAPTNGLSRQSVDVSFRIENIGFSSTGTGFVQRVFLSTDPLPGDDTLLTQATFNGPLAPGGFFAQTLRVNLPEKPGTYWIVVTTDATSQIGEVLENNNSLVSSLPVVVGKAYSVTVAANIETAPNTTPVVLSGKATRTGTGLPAAFELVEVHLSVKDTTRVLLALTDADGNYATTFTALPGEAGVYGVGADHPGVGGTLVQDTFTLLGMKARPLATLKVVEGTTATNVTLLENLSPIGLGGLTATVLAGPEQFTLNVLFPSNSLAGSGVMPLSAAITAPLGVPGSGTFRVRIDSTEGVSTTLDVPFTAEVLVPRLIATPGALNAPMRLGGQTSVEFGLTNRGGTATGPITVLAPALPWLTVSSGGQLPALAPGEGTTVSLLLTPPDDLPLGDHGGSLVVNGGNAGLTVPFTFRALSDDTGHLRLTAVDELTFYAEGSPVLTNAAVTLSDAFSKAVLLRTNFLGAGELLLTNLAEAFYDLRVEAAGHAPFSQTFVLQPGRTNEISAFLSRQTVRYTWTVEPITIEDRYDIVVETVFEANLPIPVVTAEPTIFDLADFPGETKQIDVKITNHGLLAAQAVKFAFGTHPRLSITPLIDDIGELPAKSSLIVPVTIRKLPAAAPIGRSAIAQTDARRQTDGEGDAGCSLGGKLEWSVECAGQMVTTTIPFNSINLQDIPGFQCGTSAQSLAASFPVFIPSGRTQPCLNGPCTIGNPGYQVPIAFEKRTVCDPCVNTIVGGLAENCLPLIPWPDEIEIPLFDEDDEDAPENPKIPIPPLFDAPDPECGDGAAPVEQLVSCFQEALGEVKDTVKSVKNIAEELDDLGVPTPPGLGESFGALLKPINAGLGTVDDALGVLRCLSPLFNPCIFGGGIGASSVSPASTGGRAGVAQSSADIGRGIIRQTDETIVLPSPTHPLAPLANRAVALQTHSSYFTNLLGDAAWFRSDSDQVWVAWMEAYLVTLGTNSPGGGMVTTEERNSLLALALPSPVGTNEVNALVDRWNRSVSYWTAGIFNSTNVPAGQSANFLALDTHARLHREAYEAKKAARAEGFAGVFDAYNSTRRDLLDILNNNTGGICARIKLRLEQQAVLSRDAFRAMLELENGLDVPLEEIEVTLKTTDIDGKTTTTSFQIRQPELNGVTGVAGNGIVLAHTTGKATWVLVPAPEAAPTAAKQHFVTGTLSYRQEGVRISIPLEPSMITVLPSPKLLVQYFHQRDVVSDDPFTDEVEPAEPFSLGILIANEGFGASKNFRITSGQPTIVDNQKGLLVNFEIIATEVAGLGLTPSLTANFGDIAPGARKVGRWLFKSSLQGLFTDYKASFEHVDGLGDKRLSLIDRLEIHEMIRMVQADRALEDGQPDFLVSDVPDLRDFPDTIWFSHGSNAPVATVTNGAFSGTVSANNLTVQMSADLGAGWSYVRLPDPADARFRLREVRRADNSLVGVNTNAWRTDRTFIGFGFRPKRENILHLLDLQSAPGTKTYTLVYEPAATAADVTAPTSSVAALPATSPLGFTVQWSGDDGTNGSGVAFFDVFVSVNGTGFTNWLANTTAGGAVFLGEPGKTYAFFTRATDAAGNREAAPATADAQTVASQVNTAPVLSYPAEVVVDEGTTLTALPTAADTDVPAQTLTFAAVGPVPAGLTINSANGRLNFPTSEGTGPSTNLVKIRVTDSGFPPLSATSSVALVVREVNLPPVFNFVADAVVSEGSNFVFLAQATDPDLPANKITYSLGAEAPVGATIQPTSGIFAWKPNSSAGPSTNRITLVATDDGVPPLSGTRTFTVVVRDTAADFFLAVGSTNVFGGESNSVPVRLRTDLPLTELAFELNLTTAALTNLALTGLASEVIGNTFTPTSRTNASVRLLLDGVVPVSIDRTLGRLGFLASSNGPSSVTIVQPRAPAALTAAGATGGKTQIGFGRVVVVNGEPVLTLDAPLDPVLSLYGRPGRTYSIESGTSVPADASWQSVTNVLLEGRLLRWSAPPTEALRFYRAKE